MNFKPSRALSWLLLCACTACAFSAAHAAQEVRVGAAHFPPYVVRPERGGDTGLLPELLDALNRAQDQYHFVLVPTSLPRRFHDLQQARIDMAIFENPAWGWQDVPHVAVDLGLEDAELFVARNDPGRQQVYFNQLEGKRLALFSGYHYAFAGFNNDPAYLAQTFNATLTYSHASNLALILRDRADIALITRSYLTQYLREHPDEVGKFLLSERIDQVYHHYALLRPHGPISAQVFSTYMARLRDEGELLRLFKPYRIKVLPLAVDPPPAAH